jgi:hypothetical protein
MELNQRVIAAGAKQSSQLSQAFAALCAAYLSGCGLLLGSLLLERWDAPDCRRLSRCGAGGAATELVVPRVKRDIVRSTLWRFNALWLFTMPPPRFQDLSRQQAYAVESRVLQRFVPLLTPRDDAGSAEVHGFFSHLFDFIHILADLGLGNKTPDQMAGPARGYHKHLHPDELFIEESKPAAYAIGCVTDALGQLDLVRYFFSPGLLERDRQNPDVPNLIGGGGLTLKKLGMQESIFMAPAVDDCNFVFQHRSQSRELVTEEFFSRPLWPNMPFGLEHVILTKWKGELEKRRLYGIVASFEGYRNGIYLTQVRDGSENQERMMTLNQVTLNFSNGSSFTGPLAVGENIKISYEAAAGTPKEEFKERLEHLVKTVSALAEKLDKEDDKIDVSTELKTFVEEAKKEKPSKRMLGSMADGMIEIAKNAATMVTPVSEAIRSVLALLGSQ